MRTTVRAMRAMRVMRVMRAIFASIFFLQLVWKVVDFSPRNIDLAPDYHYKPPAHHLESGDDPGDENKRYNLAPRILSLSLGN